MTFEKKNLERVDGHHPPHEWRDVEVAMESHRLLMRLVELCRVVTIKNDEVSDGHVIAVMTDGPYTYSQRNSLLAALKDACDTLDAKVTE